MSDRVNQLLSDAIKQHVALSQAYHRDVELHADVERLRQLLYVVEKAMRNEGASWELADRVLRGVIAAAVEGWTVQQEMRAVSLRRLAGALDVPEYLLDGREWA